MTMTKVVVLVVVPQRWRWVEMRLSEVEGGGWRRNRMNEWIKREEERLMAGKQSQVEQASKAL